MKISWIFLVILFAGCSANSKLSEDKEIVEKQVFTYLALGDSYTIGTSEKAENSYPNLIKQRFDNDSQELQVSIEAKNGWKTTDLLSAINIKGDSTLRYDLVSLLIGVNDQYAGEDIGKYKHRLLQIITNGLISVNGDRSKLFMIGIPDYGFTPLGAEKKTQISAELDQYNAIAKNVCDSLGLEFFNITPITRSFGDDLTMLSPDKLHPSKKQYNLWVDHFYSSIEDKFK